MKASSAPPAEETPQSAIDILVCGLPGSRLSAAIEYLRQSYVQTADVCRVINVNTINDDVQREIEAAEGPRLFWADCPDQSVVRWLRLSSTPILLIDVPFKEVGLEFMASRGASVSDCARVLALARSGWWQLAQLSRSIIVDCADEIGAKIAPVLSSWQLVSPPPHVQTGSGTAEKFHADPQPQMNSQIIAHLGAFYGNTASADARELIIPLPLLFDGAPPQLPLCGSLDLTGPVRALSFGPFLYLPQGQWELHFSFEAIQNRASNSLMFDIFVDNESKCATEFELKHDGRFEFACEFAVQDPWSTFEFRSHLRRGAIEGCFTPLSLSVRRL